LTSGEKTLRRKESSPKLSQDDTSALFLLLKDGLYTWTVCFHMASYRNAEEVLVHDI